MPKLARQMGALEVKRLTDAGLYMVGGVSGLCLNISKTGARSWILRTVIGGKRSDVGLGPYPEVTLAIATEKAAAIKSDIRNGINPVLKRQQDRSHLGWTFRRCASEYVKLHSAGWKNVKHAAQWEATLEKYVYPNIGPKPVKDISASDVLACIEPMWLSKTETATRVRGRIEAILGWAASRDLRSKENPARWKGGLEHSLPKPSKVSKVVSHKALPFRDIYGFMQRLTASNGMGARALEWVILTACRSGEARGATWAEIDLQENMWIIPAGRMKADREHRVPLSKAAIDFLDKLPRFKTDGPDYLFPSSANKQLSDMTLTAVLRRLKIDVTAHGFRSTFMDWAAETTAYPQEVRELALAHSIANKTESAYRRGDMLDKRRNLMNDWASFLYTRPSNGANVVSIKAA